MRSLFYKPSQNFASNPGGFWRLHITLSIWILLVLFRGVLSFEEHAVWLIVS